MPKTIIASNNQPFHPSEKAIFAVHKTDNKQDTPMHAAVQENLKTISLTGLSRMFFEIYAPYCIVLKEFATIVPISTPGMPIILTKTNEIIRLSAASIADPFFVCL